MEELISVIVPVYNAEKTLERCLNSILQQVYKEIEVICVDDGSKDNSLSTLKRFEQFDKRVKVITKVNEGVSVARNVGIKASNGQYILFVDSDDYIEKNMILDLYQAMKKTEADIAIEGYREINHESSIEVYDYKNCIEKKDFLLKCIQHTGGVVCSKLYTTAVIKENNIFFRKDLSLSEDLIFALECMKRAKRLIQIEQADYVYDRRNEKCRKIDVIERLKKNITVHNLIVELLEDQEIEEKKEILKKRITLIIYVNLLELSQRKEFENFKKASGILQQYYKQMNLDGYDFISKMWLKVYKKKLWKLAYFLCKIRIVLVAVKKKLKRVSK